MNIRHSSLPSSVLILWAFASCMAFAGDTKTSLSDAEIKEKIIVESIAAYPGNCPCPYNSARNGSRCGKRSAWRKSGGYAPICYENEITKEMVQSWRNSH